MLVASIRNYSLELRVEGHHRDHLVHLLSPEQLQLCHCSQTVMLLKLALGRYLR